MQKFNVNIKKIGQLAGINAEEIIKHHIGKYEVDIIKPKYEFMSSHMGRRTLVSILLELKIPAITVMKLTGHSDIRTLYKYGKATDKAVEEALERVGELGKSKMKIA